MMKKLILLIALGALTSTTIAQKGTKEVAKMTVRILTNVLDTKTITDKNKIIDLLLTITETHSDVEVPLLIK